MRNEEKSWPIIAQTVGCSRQTAARVYKLEMEGAEGSLSKASDVLSRGALLSLLAEWMRHDQNKLADRLTALRMYGQITRVLEPEPVAAQVLIVAPGAERDEIARLHAELASLRATTPSALEAANPPQFSSSSDPAACTTTSTSTPQPVVCAPLTHTSPSVRQNAAEGGRAPNERGEKVPLTTPRDIPQNFSNGDLTRAGEAE